MRLEPIGAVNSAGCDRRPHSHAHGLGEAAGPRDLGRAAKVWGVRAFLDRIHAVMDAIDMAPVPTMPIRTGSAVGITATLPPCPAATGKRLDEAALGAGHEVDQVIHVRVAGVLGAYRRDPRGFDDSDADFLRLAAELVR